MAENNEKIIENQEISTEIVEEKETTEEKTEKAEWEIQLEKMIHNAYLKGIAMGGKSFVGVIFDIIIKGRKNRQNTAKILMQIERTCKRLLDVSESYTEKNKAENNENTTEEQTEQIEASTETTDTKVDGGESVE